MTKTVSRKTTGNKTSKKKVAKKPTPAAIAKAKAVTAASMAFDDLLVADIGKNEKRAMDASAAGKQKIEDKNTAKIDAYSDLIALLASEKLTPKGNLPVEIGAAVTEMLEVRANIKPATAKRYKENSVAVIRDKHGIFGIPTQASPEAVRDILKRLECTSEAKLVKTIANATDADPLEEMAKKLYGKTNKNGTFIASKFTEDDWNKFADYCEVQKAARVEADRAAAAAAAKATEEVETVNAIVEAMEGK